MSIRPDSTDSCDAPSEPAWDIALLFPTQGNWTEDDYLELDTSRMVEFSHGYVEVLPMPSKEHQRIVRHLFLLIHQYVTANRVGEVFFAPLPVRLWPDKFREPDIVFLRNGRSEFRGRPEGADLVVEVLSEGAVHRRRDLETKPAEYAKAGIAEYWIVDPELQQITVLTLVDTVYRVHGVYGVPEQAQSVLFHSFSFSVRDVFAAASDSSGG